MSILGSNKQAIKRARKNILPPFDDPRWKPTSESSIKDLSRQGIGVSFRSTSNWNGLYFEVPLKYAGRRLSYSVSKFSGKSPRIELLWLENGVQKLATLNLSDNSKSIVDIDIPIIATNIRALVNVGLSNTGDYHYFESVQLEVGYINTQFSESFEIPKGSKDYMKFDGSTGYLKTDRVIPEIKVGGSYTIEVVLRNYGDNDGVVIQNSHGGDDRNGLIVRGNQVVLGSYNGSNWSGTMGVLPDTEFAHIIAVCDGVNRFIFVNGKKFTTSSSLYVHTLKDGMYIGKETIGDSARFFEGEIKLIRAYGYSMNDEDAISAYTGILVPEKLLIELDFTNQDITSKSVVDTSGNSNNALISGGVHYSKSKPIKNLGKNLLRSPLIKGYLASDSSMTGDKDVYRSFERDIYLPAGTYTFSCPKGITIIRRKINNDVFSTSGSSSTITLNTSSYVNFSFRQSEMVGWSYGENSEEANLQLEKGNVITAFSNYEESNKLIKKILPRRSFKETVYDFSRYSSNLYEGLIYGINQPRLRKDSSLILEDGSSNVISQTSDGESVNHWGRDTNDVTIVQSQEVKPLFGKYVAKWSKASKTNTGNCYLNGSNKINNQEYSRHWTFSCYVKREDGNPVTSVGWIYLYATSKATNTSLVSNAYPDYIQECEDGWYRVSRTVIVNQDSYVTLAGFSALDGSTSWYFDGWKLEKNPFATSYIEDGNPRVKEYMSVPEASKYIDPVRGSVEIEVNALSGQGYSDGYGFNDLVMYDGSRGFLIRRNVKVGTIEIYVAKNGGQFSQISYPWKCGESLKYRLEWDSVKDITKLTVNDVNYSQEVKCFAIPETNLEVGCRKGDYINGNASYKNLIIRNRLGETVFKL